MLSNNLEFKKLLLLHGKDRRKQSMETELENLPHSISHIESKIEVENATIASATQELRNLEIYIAPLEEQKCSGCNLRVSNDVVSSVLVEQKLTHCDQCGRIVYFER